MMPAAAVQTKEKTLVDRYPGLKIWICRCFTTRQGIKTNRYDSRLPGIHIAPYPDIHQAYTKNGILHIADTLYENIINLFVEQLFLFLIYCAQPVRLENY